METSWIHRYSSLDECLQDICPPQFLFMSRNIKKTCTYYEAIMIKSGSAIITRTLNSQSPKKSNFFKSFNSKGFIF